MCADLFRLQFPLCPCAESSWLELILNFLRSNLKSKSWFVKTKLFKGRGTHRILSVCFPVFPGFLLLKWIGLFTFAVLVLIFQEHTSGTTWHNSIGTVHQSLSSGPWGRGGGRPDTGNARTVAQAQDSSERLGLNAAPEWMNELPPRSLTLLSPAALPSPQSEPRGDGWSLSAGLEGSPATRGWGRAALPRLCRTAPVLLVSQFIPEGKPYRNLLVDLRESCFKITRFWIGSTRCFSSVEHSLGSTGQVRLNLQDFMILLFPCSKFTNSF